mmetsp:Transcript_147323/g.473351  ORF Transcript_147323/g.473351 Transcript_147323/m.473351 type:complete len:1569 (+) Transcript_147323:88-4794(+)
MRTAIFGPKKQVFVPAGIDKVALAKTLGVEPETEPETFKFLSKALDHPLPEPWTEQIDSKKRVFYWNPVSRQSAWNHPLAATHKALVVAFRRIVQAEDKAAALEAEIEAFHRQGEDEISKWRQSHSPEGTPYFYKVGTQLTRWDNPRDEVLTHMELRVRMLSELGEDLVKPKFAIKKKKGNKKALQTHAVVKIQRQMKVALCSVRLRRRVRMRIKIQCLIRGFLARRRVKHMREDLARRKPTVKASSPRKYTSPVNNKSRGIAAALTGAADEELVSDLAGQKITDEIALTLGMNFQDPVDMAAFAILCPLFLRVPPDPWQVVKRDHGRTDFYHPGMREERRQHPLFSFFAEVLGFLRAHSRTNVPITEAMTAQIFREASPQILRERLGVWEGPAEDPALLGGVLFVLIVEGIDPTVPGGTRRRDDPRLEAAANVAARLAGWHHLWTGFAPDEPFPLLEGRLAALASQLSEAVVVAPGPAAEALLELMVSRQVRPKPTSPRLSPAETALQPLVVGMLGKAYGMALQAAGNAECAYIRGEPPEVIVYSDEEDEVVVETKEEEEEAVEDEEYEDDVLEAEESDEEEPIAAEESDHDEDLAAELARSAASSPTGAKASLRAATFDFPDPELEGTDEPRETQGFLPRFKLDSAADWAENALRPLTPPREQAARAPASPSRTLPPRNLQRLKVKEESLWTTKPIDPKPIVDLSVGTIVCGAPDDLSEEALAGAPTELPPAPAAGPSLEIPPPPKPNALVARKKESVKVDDFWKSLSASQAIFDDKVTQSEAAPDEKAWSLKALTEREAPLPESDRINLEKIFVAPKEGKFEDGDGKPHGTDADVQAWQGAAARPSSPQHGAAQLPDYLAKSKEPDGKQRMPLMWRKGRSGSRGGSPGGRPGASVRGRSAGPESTGRVPRALDRRPRPPSAQARSRMPCAELTPPKPDRSMLQAVSNLKAFLSRTCGTMQFALKVFDPSGDGRFDRHEWETGLRKLDYNPSVDCQVLFTALDKRRHHVLTISDLIDKFSGMSIQTGVPPLGIRGPMSEILHEAMQQMFLDILHEALVETVGAALLEPSGPQNSLPDITKFLKKCELKRKKQKKLQEEQEKLQAKEKGKKGKSQVAKPESPMKGKSPLGAKANPFDPESLTDDGSPGKSSALTGKSKSPKGSRTGSNRHGSRGRNRSRNRGLSAGAESSGGGSSRSSSKKGKTSKNKGKKNRHKSRHGGSSAGSSRSRSTGSRGSPASSSRRDKPNKSSNKKKQTQRNKSGTSEASDSSRERRQRRQFQRRTSSMKSMKEEGQPHVIQHRRDAAGKTRGKHGSLRAGQDDFSDDMSAGHTASREERQRHLEHHLAASKGKFGAKGGGKGAPQQFRNDYAGFRFVENPEFWQEEPDRSKQKSFVPRPLQDVVRTYGHIYQLLSDPRVQKIQAKQQMKKTLSMHVSVPQMPGLFPRGRPSTADEEASLSESDPCDTRAPLSAAHQQQAVSGSKPGQWRSKSVPGLGTGLSQAETTAGTWPRANISSDSFSPSSSPSCSLPSLSSTAPYGRPDIHARGAGISGIDAESRRIPLSLGGTM